MKQNKKFYKLIAFLLRPIVKILFPYEVIGIENSKNLTGSYILCSNHLSNMDPVFFIISHPKPICFMAKAELFKNKISKWFFSALGAFSVKRGQADQNALSEAQQILKNKDVMGMFIEGTRSKTGEFLRPKSGVAMLAATSKVPILPVCITGTSPNNKIHMLKKTIIKYNKPIMPDELGMSEFTRSNLKLATTLIMDKIKEMRD